MTRATPTRITTHPGKILDEDFMVPLGLSARSLGEALDMPPNRLTAIINGRRSVTANTALRLGNFFRTTPELWLNLQQAYDLSRERAEGSAYARPSVSLKEGEVLTLDKILVGMPAERRQKIERRAAHLLQQERKRKKRALVAG